MIKGRIGQSVVAVLLTAMSATPVLAADTNNNNTMVPLGKVVGTMFKPEIPASWIPQLKLIGAIIAVTFVLAIGILAVRIFMQHEDKSQAISEILKLVALVVVAAVVLYKLIPAIL